jgi:two-component system, NtrC family, sensor kinase
VTEALEQQTATSEILRVISSSPTDVQPVFETIAQRAKRLCDARECGVFRFDGALIHLVAQADTSASWAQALRSAFPRPPGRGSMTARAVLTRSVVHVADVLADPEFDLAEAARASGIRSVLSVPILRDGEIVGVITVDRRQPQPFLETQIALVKTFAAQAVIAIENVRLFSELQARNRDVTEALEQQMATGEILRVIASSPTDLQPVLDAMAESAARLCTAYDASILRVDGDVLRLVAHYGPIANPLGLAVPAIRGTVTGCTVLDRRMVQVADVQAETQEFPEGSTFARDLGHRTLLSVPLLREGIAIGAIGVRRTEVQPFTDKQVALLQTFADQAVIAIENVRLFKELEARTQELTRSVGELTALGEVGRALSSTLDLETVLQTIVLRANQLAGTAGCTIWEYDEPREEFRLRVSHYADEADAAALQGVDRVTTIRKGLGGDDAGDGAPSTSAGQRHRCRGRRGESHPAPAHRGRPSCAARRTAAERR